MFCRWAYILLACNVLYLTLLLIIFAICTPFAFIWNKTIEGGHCGNQIAGFTATGVINLFLDICIIIQPMPVLWKLRIPLQKKIGLAIMFSVGSV